MPGKRSRLKPVRLLAAAVSALVVPILVAVAYYAYEVRDARHQTQAIVASAWSHHGRQLTTADLSAERRETLLAIADPAFMRHHGVDLETPGAGMTTLTQGLVKLLYFPNGFRPGVAKIRQTLIAQYALDSLVSQEEQLDLFLNMAYLGHKDGKAVHGFAAGSRTYLGKDFSTLNDVEFLSLVAMLIGPNTFKPGTAAHDQRMRRIHAYLSGEYQPVGVLDVEYDGRDPGSVAKNALMVLLRWITDARPSARRSGS